MRLMTVMVRVLLLFIVKASSLSIMTSWVFSGFFRLYGLIVILLIIQKLYHDSSSINLHKKLFHTFLSFPIFTAYAKPAYIPIPSIFYSPFAFQPYNFMIKSCHLSCDLMHF